MDISTFVACFISGLIASAITDYLNWRRNKR